MVLEVITMDKKKLKVLLGLLGVGLIVGAIIVAVVTGLTEVGHFDIFSSDGFVVTGHKFHIDYVQFEYVVPLFIGGVISFIISSCLSVKSNKDDDKNINE